MNLGRAGVVLVAGLVLASCTPEWASQDQSVVLFRIIKITGETGGDTGDSGTGDVLNSDVTPVFNDNAIITMSAEAKNRFLSIPAPGRNDVFTERYEVRYLRSDGRNQEGVDVPYRISGPLASLVPVGGTAGAAIVIVRHQAKLEPPLWNLRGVFSQNSTVQFGGAGILSVIAEITVHGRTGTGQAVQAVGRLQINFADFADQ